MKNLCRSVNMKEDIVIEKYRDEWSYGANRTRSGFKKNVYLKIESS